MCMLVQYKITDNEQPPPSSHIFRKQNTFSCRLTQIEKLIKVEKYSISESSISTREQYFLQYFHWIEELYIRIVHWLSYCSLDSAVFKINSGQLADISLFVVIYFLKPFFSDFLKTFTSQG